MNDRPSTNNNNNNHYKEHQFVSAFSVSFGLVVVVVVVTLRVIFVAVASVGRLGIQRTLYEFDMAARRRETSTVLSGGIAPSYGHQKAVET